MIYYVKNGGSDSLSGISDAGAWAHHPWMLGWAGSVVLQPGDIVYMKRGSNWIMSGVTSPIMKINSSQGGSAGHHILTGSYGTGLKPILKINTNNNFPVISIEGSSYITFDSLDIQHYTGVYQGGLQGGIIITTNWPDTPTIIPHDIIITNCDIHEIPMICVWGLSDSYNIIIGDVNATTMATTIVHSNNFYNFGNSGVTLQGSNPIDDVSNFQVYYNYIHDTTQHTIYDEEYGVLFTANAGSNGWPNFGYVRYNRVENIKTWEALDCHGGSNLYWEYNHIINFSTRGILVGAAILGALPTVSFNIYITGNIFEGPPVPITPAAAFIEAVSYTVTVRPTNIQIVDNIFRYSIPTGFGPYPGIIIHNFDGILISGNKFENKCTGFEAIALVSEDGWGVDNVIIRNNFIAWSAGISVDGPSIHGSCKIYDNIINTGGIGLAIYYGNIPNGGILEIYNNDITSDAQITIYTQYAGVDMGGTIIAKNNIIACLGVLPVDHYYWYIANTIIGTYIIDHNLYFGNTLSGQFRVTASVKSLSQWQLLGFDFNSIGPNSDPLFANDSGIYSLDTDFILEITSPAVKKGEDVSLQTDYNGRKFLTIPVIGAIEYSGSLCKILSLLYNSSQATKEVNLKTNLYSIRVIKDSTTLTHGQRGFYIGNNGVRYGTICIGSQEWVIDNLIETQFRDGSAIPRITDSSIWPTLSTPMLCEYNNDWNNV